MSAELEGALDAEQLRREFDASFRGAIREREEHVDLLAIRAGGHPFALRLTQIAGLARTPRIVAAPSAEPWLLGLASVRGTVLPVYDLALALGLARPREPRWLVVSESSALALAFEDHEAYVRLARSGVASGSEGGSAFVEAVATIGDAPRPVLDVRAVCAAISERAGAGAARPRRSEDAR